MAKCGEKTEVYSRVCGYFRPVSNWNKSSRTARPSKSFRSNVVARHGGWSGPRVFLSGGMPPVSGERVWISVD